MRKKQPIPPRPECGSIEQNQMIRAINEHMDNPYPTSKACTEFWDSLVKEKTEMPDCYFSCVEPDEYEDYRLSHLL